MTSKQYERLDECADSRSQSRWPCAAYRREHRSGDGYGDHIEGLSRQQLPHFLADFLLDQMITN